MALKVFVLGLYSLESEGHLEITKGPARNVAPISQNVITFDDQHNIWWSAYNIWWSASPWPWLCSLLFSFLNKALLRSCSIELLHCACTSRCSENVLRCLARLEQFVLLPWIIIIQIIRNNRIIRKWAWRLHAMEFTSDSLHAILCVWHPGTPIEILKKDQRNRWELPKLTNRLAFPYHTLWVFYFRRGLLMWFGNDRFYLLLLGVHFGTVSLVRFCWVGSLKQFGRSASKRWQGVLLLCSWCFVWCVT